MHQRVLLALAVAVSLTSGGCRKPAPSAVEQGPPAWRFAVLPAVREAHLREVYQPLLAALSRATGRTVVFEMAADYRRLKDDLLAGRVHLAQASAYLYASIAVARAREGAPVHLLAQEKRAAQDRHAGALVVAAGSPIETTADLAGKTIAWVDGDSSSGYIYPRLRLRELGHDPDRLFGRQLFSHSHEAVLAAVRAGQADVGAVSDLSASTSGLRVIERTAPIPDDAILSLDALDAADRAAVTRLLLGAHQDPTLASFFIGRGLERYVAAEVAVYEVVGQELERSPPGAQ